MDFTEPGIVTDLRLLQLEKAKSSIVSTPSRKSTEVNPLWVKAEFPIVSTLSARVTESRYEQLAKAL